MRTTARGEQGDARLTLTAPSLWPSPTSHRRALPAGFSRTSAKLRPPCLSAAQRPRPSGVRSNDVSRQSSSAMEKTSVEACVARSSTRTVQSYDDV